MNKAYYKTYDEAFKGGQLIGRKYHVQPPYKDKSGWIVEYAEKDPTHCPWCNKKLFQGVGMKQCGDCSKETNKK